MSLTCDPTASFGVREFRVCVWETSSLVDEGGEDRRCAARRPLGRVVCTRPAPELDARALSLQPPRSPLTSKKSERKGTATPGASKVPVVGNLFKSKERTDELDEMLIFIAPKVVD